MSNLTVTGVFVCNPLWTVCVLHCSFLLFVFFFIPFFLSLILSVSFLSPPLSLLPPLPRVVCFSSLAQTWKIYTTISIDTCLPQRTNGLAISPQHRWAVWQPLRPQALSAARQAFSPSPASRSASCPRQAEKRPSRGSRYTQTKEESSA